MLLKLDKLMLTSTHLGWVWVSYLQEMPETVASGVFATGEYVVSAGNMGCCEVWISCCGADHTGEGMGTTAAKLEGWLLGCLQLRERGEDKAELMMDQLNTMVADFVRQEF